MKEGGRKGGREREKEESKVVGRKGVLMMKALFLFETKICLRRSKTSS